VHRPPTEPIGLQIIGGAQLLSRALDDALTLAGGSLPMWRVLVSQKDQHPGAHPGQSEAMGVVRGTWSDELDRMEIAGLVIRKPDPEHPRVPGFELTEAGDAMFHPLLRAVVALDARLRTGLTDPEIAAFTSTLNRLRSNFADEEGS
jgi:MarR family transcriptional regulator, transcriptional regulator for hemolysin